MFKGRTTLKTEAGDIVYDSDFVKIVVLSDKNGKISRMKSKHTSQIDHYRNFFVTVLCIISFSLTLLIIAQLLPLTVPNNSKRDERITFDDIKNLPKVKIKENSVLGSGRNEKCTHYDCLNVYRCGHRDKYKIQVYVYPLKQYIDTDGNEITNEISIEYLRILKAIVNSEYYSPDPQLACILVPSIDTLNQNRINVKKVSKALASLP